MKDQNTPTNTLRYIDPCYENYRLLLDLIFNQGATEGDHSSLKDQVDKHFESLISEAVNKARIDSLRDFYIDNYQIIDGTPVCNALKRRIERELETSNQVEEVV